MYMYANTDVLYVVMLESIIFYSQGIVHVYLLCRYWEWGLFAFKCSILEHWACFLSRVTPLQW